MFGAPADPQDEAPCKGKQWLNELMHVFRHQGYEAGWERLTAWRGTLTAPTHRKAADSLLNYVAERRRWIRYPEIRERG